MSRKEIRDAILAKQVQIKRQEVPKGWSLEGADFINKMIQRKPHTRLGANGIEEITSHPWLADFSWEHLENKKLHAPFTPNVYYIYIYIYITLLIILYYII